MNAIFTVIIIASAIVLLFTNPEGFLPAMLSGAEQSLKLGVSLFAIYAVWLSLSEISEKCGINDRLSRLLRPLCTKCFKTKDGEAVESISMNLTCNLLGIGGAATPFGIKAVNRMEKEGNKFGQKLLFVLNATSLQLIPTTVISLRAGAGSASSGDIFLPTLICTVICTAVGVLLFLGVDRIWRR